MKEIGEFLKEARIDNGVGLEEASEDLKIPVVQLENIEEGNIRAFKDMFALKDLIRDYSKYLGVEIEQILEEFNDFMFEHTSKISLDDIKEARAISEEQNSEKEKVVSPYTRLPKEKILPIKVVMIVLGSIVGLLLLIYLIIMLIGSHKDDITTELKWKGDISYYEYS